MTTKEDRVKIIIEHFNLKQNEFAKRANVTQQMVSDVLNGKKKAGEKLLTGIMDNFTEINPVWLLNGRGDMIISDSVEIIDVNDAFEVEYFENNNSNSFIKLENGQYLMTMPLAEYNIQAGFLDVYQDIEYLKILDKHSIFVDKPVRGRYVAFRVKGDSMDSGKSDAIMDRYIVSTRELQRQHWTSKLRIKDFPYWVIFTSESRYPLLKQIVDHDPDTGIIKCHSLNDGPEYNDFELSLDSIQALFYVIDINRPVAKYDYY